MEAQKVETVPSRDALTAEQAAADARAAVVALAEGTERLRKRKAHAGQSWPDYCRDRLGIPGVAQRRAVELARAIKGRLSFKGEADPGAVAAAIPGWIDAIRQAPDTEADGVPLQMVLTPIDRPERPEPGRDRARRLAHGHRYPDAAHAALMALTRTRLEGREHTEQRPAVALRLHGEAYRVALRPGLESTPTGWRPSGVVRAEVFRVDGVEHTAVVIAELDPDGAIRPRRWRRDPEVTAAAFAALVDALERFAADPRSALAGGEHCAICGRALTDGDSIARGIGPECMDTVALAFETMDQVED